MTGTAFAILAMFFYSAWKLISMMRSAEIKIAMPNPKKLAPLCSIPLTSSHIIHPILKSKYVKADVNEEVSWDKVGRDDGKAHEVSSFAAPGHAIHSRLIFNHHTSYIFTFYISYYSYMYFHLFCYALLDCPLSCSKQAELQSNFTCQRNFM